MIIIKYYEWMRIIPDEKHPVYELCNDRFERRRELTREDAQRMIKDNNLMLVHRDKRGAIWR